MLYVPTRSDPPPPTGSTVVSLCVGCVSAVPLARHPRPELPSATRRVERGRATTLTDADRPRLLEEVRHAGHLALEVARVERPTPHRLVHAAQLGHGELTRQERHCLLRV